MEKKRANQPFALILGGSRSGKSAFAEDLLSQCCKRRVYLATAEARDAEMADRIETHRMQRGEGWRTVEAPLDPVSALSNLTKGDGVLLDCLTLWLSNQMEDERDLGLETDLLLQGLQGLKRPIVMVSNEIGMGLVPETRLGRSFRDAQGLLNQRAAAAANLVVFVAAGLPIVLKGDLP